MISYDNANVSHPTAHYTTGLRKSVLYMSACSDGAGFFSRGNQSWGPYTAVCMNLSPWLRNKFACILVFGVLPTKIKNYNRITPFHSTHTFEAINH